MGTQDEDEHLVYEGSHEEPSRPRLPYTQTQSPVPGLARLSSPSKSPNIHEKYLPPENLLEIHVINPRTQGFGRNEFTDYEIMIRVSR
jgi:hypothetical protein